ncbi:MAG: hypothetical protein GQ556_06510 [Desulfobacterales bacterium]|nr:hypothetical protein [Desulfobacterales bacterium]
MFNANLRGVNTDFVVLCQSQSASFLHGSGHILSFVPLAIGFLWAALAREQCARHDRLVLARVASAEMT